MKTIKICNKNSFEGIYNIVYDNIITSDKNNYYIYF